MNWRAQLRLAEVPRRPPPPSRPDRGFIEQPEERVEPTVVRKRGLIPMEALEREQLADLAEELGEPLEAPRISAVSDSSTEPERQRGITSRHSADPFPRPLLPQPETQPSQPPAPEPVEMAAKKKGERFPVEHKAKIVARWLELTEQAAKKGITGRATGAGSQTAREFKTSEANVSTWVMQYKKRHGIEPTKSAKTLVSSPASGPVSVAGPLPPMPTVALSGLEEYVRALVAQEVKAAIRKAFGGE